MDEAVMVTPPPLASHDDDDDLVESSSSTPGSHRMAGGYRAPASFSPPVDETEARARLAVLYPYVDQNRTPLPRFWNPNDRFPLLNISNENMRVVYRGQGKNHKDAGAVRANRPIPAACGVYYFEVTIVSKGRDGYMGIGLCERNVSLNRLPGWDKNSYGYHGDDGNFFSSSGNGTHYGPTFTTRDIVGCGINLITKTVFYTKNGVNLGPAATNIFSVEELYPTVGLQTPGEIIDTNFGQRQFRYQIEPEIKEAQSYVHKSILKFELPPQKVEWMNKLVSSYLVHYGFSGAVESFNRAANLPDEEAAMSMHNRLTIQKLVLNGRIEEAITMVEKQYPDLLKNNKRLMFMLKCRNFIEMLASLSQDAPSSSSSNNRATSTSHSARYMGAPGGAIMSHPYKRRTSYGDTRHSPRRACSDHISNGNSSHRIVHQHHHRNGDTSDEPMEMGGSTSYTNGASAGGAAQTLDGLMMGLTDDAQMNSEMAHENGTSNGNLPPLMLYTTTIVAEDDSDEEMDGSMDGYHYRQSSSMAQFEKYADLLEYGKALNELSKEMPPSAGHLVALMNDAFSMICYERPRDSAKGYLLDPIQRRSIASALNSAILESQGQPGRPPLEKLFAHARYLRRRLADGRIGGSAFADAEHLVFERETALI